VFVCLVYYSEVLVHVYHIYPNLQQLNIAFIGIKLAFDKITCDVLSTANKIFAHLYLVTLRQELDGPRIHLRKLHFVGWSFADWC